MFIHAGAKKGLRPAYIRYLNPLPPQPTNTHESDYEEEDSNNSGYESPFVDGKISQSILVIYDSGIFQSGVLLQFYKLFQRGNTTPSLHNLQLI